MNTDRLRRGAAVAFAAIVAASAAFAGNAPRPAQAADLAATSFTPADSLRILGRDGRFTILLLGSDARPSLSGLRTDAILIASVDPVTGKAAIASIPRDTAYFPLSPLRTGKFSGRINALYSWIKRYYPKRNPGTELRKIIGKALGVEIDAFAMLGFDGYRRSVNNVGGLDVYVAKTLYDPVYSMRRGQHGVRFYRGWNHLVDLRALAYARIRHLEGGDYNRSRRQQQLIAAAVGKVRLRGVDSLASLIAASGGLRKTDLPLAYAPLIFAMVSRANVAQARRVVFQPRTYAYGISSYRIVLKMAAVRAWVRTYFPPAHYLGTWLPPEPAPTPTPTPAPTPTPTPTPEITPTPTPTPTPEITPTPTPTPTPDPTPTP
jgi:LCP family protein required for cell wall assembly